VKKHVLQFVGSFHQGGSERQAVALTRGLTREGSFKVSIATLNGEGVLRSDIEQLGLKDIPEYPLTSFFSKSFVSQILKCAKYLKSNKIDIVHTHDFYTNVFGMAAARVAGIEAKIASKRETLGMRTANQIRVEKLAFAIADAIVVNSRAVGDYLGNIGVSDKKISLIYNGLDLQRFVDPQTLHEGFKAGFAIPSSSKLVTLVANLRHDVKNVPMLLRAAKAVLETSPTTAFLIAGEGELQPEYERLAAELKVAENVHFIGRCADVTRLLAASDVCVLTSTAEGFSNSILEYMAAGKPVIATNVGGASEAIDDGATGYLIDSDDDRLLAARLIELLSDPDKSKLFGLAGREKVEKNFSETSQIERTIALYRSLLK
jgi:glycosyltransferase involved in cell wall biosynthesis